MKKILFPIVLLMMVISVHGQKVYTKTGTVTFFSSTPIEDIEAVTNSATSVIDLESGKMENAILIKSFEFEKALMQEHFNENYMESSTYPKATFKGQMDKKIDLSKDGTYEVNCKGKMTIHGVTNDITFPATLIVEDGTLKGKSVFTVLVADYGIEVPSVVRENIAKEIEVRINTEYEQL